MPDDLIDDRRLVAELTEMRELVHRAERRESNRWVLLWPKLAPETRLARWRIACREMLGLNKPITWRGRSAQSNVVPDGYDGRSFVRGDWL